MIHFMVIFLLSISSLHAWPTSVEQANASFSDRRKNIVKAWVAKYLYDWERENPSPGENQIDDDLVADRVSATTGFDHWRRDSIVITGWEWRLVNGTPIYSPIYETRKLNPIDGIRKMAAGFYVFTHQQEFSNVEFSRLSGEVETQPFSVHLAAWQIKVLSHLQTIRQFKEVGTETGETMNNMRYAEADYDFLLKELISVVYAFREYPNVLTTQMIEAIILQPIAPPGYNGSNITGKVVASGQNPDVFTTVRSSSGSGFFTVDDDWANVKTTQPETENHVLMVTCWTYLVQNYLEWVVSLPSGHPRKSTALTNAYNSDPARYTNTEAYHSFILQVLGRLVNNGVFETNAKPYESITTSAIQCLYSYAHVLFPNDLLALKIRQAAENAMNMLATQFAFQSIGGKRLGPMRRNFSNRSRMHPYANDYMSNIFGILSGAYNYDDGIYANSISTSPASNYPYRPYMYQKVSQSGAFALWSALMEYRIPEVIHDFMIHGTVGHWMRVNPHFLRGDRGAVSADRDYRGGHYDLGFNWEFAGIPSNPGFVAYPVYTKSSGAFLSYANRDNSGATLNESSQLYLVTPHFANVAGGYGVHYFHDVENGNTVNALKSYDYMAKPTLILPKFDIGIDFPLNEAQELDIDSYETPQFESESITMRGGEGIYAQNQWVYKNFAYGYYYDGYVNRRLQWPQKYPASWEASALQEFSIGRAVFKIFDFRSLTSAQHPLGGQYLVISRLSKTDIPLSSNSASIWGFLLYARGFWEVVPGGMYSNTTSLRNQILATNPSTYYDGNFSNHYKYVMASTGEYLELDNAVGSTVIPSADPNGIRTIKTSATGSVIPLNTYMVDRATESAQAAPGLIDVWEVNSNFAFTGIKYVSTNQMGNWQIVNPRIGKSLFINGSNFDNPISVKAWNMPDVGTLKFVSSAGGGLKLDSKGNALRVFVENGASWPIKFQFTGQAVYEIGAGGESTPKFIYRTNTAPFPDGIRFTNETTGVTIQLQTDGTFTTTGFGEYYDLAVPQG